MIYLIHGDDNVSAGKKVDEIINQNKPLIRVDFRKEELYKFSEALAGRDLFSVQKIVLAENAFRLPAKSFNKLLENIEKADLENIDLIFLENEKLKKIQEEKIKNSKIFKFVLPQYYFEFIDSLAPRNGKNLVSLFRHAVETQSSEEVFYSITRRLRLLILLRQENYNHSDIQKLNSWQITRIEQQAKRWKNQELSDFYNKLFEIEVKMKSGELPLPLKDYIDILLLSL